MTTKPHNLKLESISMEPDGSVAKGDLLFLHGAWHSASCWNVHMLSHFADKGYRSTAKSLRGHGSSQGSMRFATIKDYVEDLVAMADAMPSPPVLIAHSMGGFIAQHALKRLQGRLKGLVLMASVPPSGVKCTTLRIAIRHPFRFILCLLTWSLKPLVATPKLVRELFFLPDTDESIVKKCGAKLGGESYSAFLTMLFNRPDLSSVGNIPVLVLGGNQDKIILPNEVEETAKAFNVEATLFEGMPHDMMLVENWAKVADAILQFLEGIESRQTTP